MHNNNNNIIHATSIEEPRVKIYHISTILYTTRAHNIIIAKHTILIIDDDVSCIDSQIDSRALYYLEETKAKYLWRLWNEVIQKSDGYCNPSNTRWEH